MIRKLFIASSIFSLFFTMKAHAVDYELFLGGSTDLTRDFGV